MKLILIGQAPGKTGDPKKPLEGGRVARRLADCFGVSVETYRKVTERRNLLNRWPGKNGKGDAFPMKKARDAARRFLPYMRKSVVVFLGKNVALAFGLDIDYFKWTRQQALDIAAAVFPHPSGVNRWWNEKRNVRRAKRFLREALRRTAS